MREVGFLKIESVAKEKEDYLTVSDTFESSLTTKLWQKAHKNVEIQQR